VRRVTNLETPLLLHILQRLSSLVAGSAESPMKIDQTDHVAENRRLCTEGETCARPLPNRIIKASLILETILVIAVLGVDFVASLLNS
jgi:hypothetical protein